jgi:hypothetical protein
LSSNPYDGHTLDKTVRDAEKITGIIVEEVFPDKRVKEFSLDIRLPGERLAYFCRLIAKKKRKINKVFFQGELVGYRSQIPRSRVDFQHVKVGSANPGSCNLIPDT